MQVIVLARMLGLAAGLKNRPAPPIIQCRQGVADAAGVGGAITREPGACDMIRAARSSRRSLTPLETMNPELMSRERPPSPCTKVCTLDAQGFCAGCLRTGAEIGRWMSMSAVEQWQLIAELQNRRKLREPAQSK